MADVGNIGAKTYFVAPNPLLAIATTTLNGSLVTEDYGLPPFHRLIH